MAFISLIFKFGWIVSLSGLVVEIIGFVIYSIHFVKTEWTSIRRPGVDLATAMDGAYARYGLLMADLYKISSDELEDRLYFSKHRMEVSGRKVALIVGSFEKLGLLPALVGVLLQIRSVVGDPQQNGWLWFAIGAGAIAIYLASLFVTRIALRQAFYVDVLETALAFRRTPRPQFAQIS